MIMYGSHIISHRLFQPTNLPEKMVDAKGREINRYLFDRVTERRSDSEGYKQDLGNGSELGAARVTMSDPLMEHDKSKFERLIEHEIIDQ